MSGSARKLKIAEVITRLDWGGSPDIVRILAAGLDPARYDVTLYSGPSAHMTAKTRRFLASFKGRSVEIPALKRDIDPVKDIAALRALVRAFRQERFDAIHTHTSKAGALGRVAARIAGCRAVVHTPHGHTAYGYFGPAASKGITLIERSLAPFCDTLIALTELEKRDMVRFGIAPEGKIRVIYQGLELDDYRRPQTERGRMRASFGFADGDLVVGTVGRLELVKGTDRFVEAAARVVRDVPAARFLIVGEGSLRQRLEERVSALGLGGRTVFAGWRTDVPAVLSALDLFVMPSQNEAVGMALIEAQAAGVPAAAFRVGGIPEVLEDGKAGMLVPPGDDRALAAAIVVLLADAEKRRAMGEAGRRFVEGKFRARAMVDLTAGLYEDLCRPRQPPGI